jgi:hypothetical protein
MVVMMVSIFGVNKLYEILKYSLSCIALVSLALIVYGGFVYILSKGKERTVRSAKGKMLIGGVMMAPALLLASLNSNIAYSNTPVKETTIFVASKHMFKTYEKYRIIHYTCEITDQKTGRVFSFTNSKEDCQSFENGHTYKISYKYFEHQYHLLK